MYICYGIIFRGSINVDGNGVGLGGGVLLVLHFLSFLYFLFLVLCLFLFLFFPLLFSFSSHQCAVWEGGGGFLSGIKSCCVIVVWGRLQSEGEEWRCVFYAFSVVSAPVVRIVRKVSNMRVVMCGGKLCCVMVCVY
jgi:hypothetical protein